MSDIINPSQYSDNGNVGSSGITKSSKEKSVVTDDDATCLLGPTRQKSKASWLEFLKEQSHSKKTDMHRSRKSRPYVVQRERDTLSSTTTDEHSSLNSNDSRDSPCADCDEGHLIKLPYSRVPNDSSDRSIKQSIAIPPTCSIDRQFNDESDFDSAGDGLNSECQPILNISNSQLHHYTNYFYQMCPDPYGNTDSVKVFSFFKLSNLPDKKLKEIWNQADRNKDGELDLKEFIVAMYLIGLEVSTPVGKEQSLKINDKNKPVIIGRVQEQPVGLLKSPSNIHFTTTQINPVPSEFTSRLDNGCALIAPKPLRPSSRTLNSFKYFQPEEHNIDGDRRSRHFDPDDDQQIHIVPRLDGSESTSERRTSRYVCRYFDQFALATTSNPRYPPPPPLDLAYNLSKVFPKLDADIKRLSDQLNQVQFDDIKQQASLNSEIESCLVHWRRCLSSIIDYRINLESFAIHDILESPNKRTC